MASVKQPAEHLPSHNLEDDDYSPFPVDLDWIKLEGRFPEIVRRIRDSSISERMLLSEMDRDDVMNDAVKNNDYYTALYYLLSTPVIVTYCCNRTPITDQELETFSKYDSEYIILYQCILRPNTIERYTYDRLLKESRECGWKYLEGFLIAFAPPISSSSLSAEKTD